MEKAAREKARFNIEQVEEDPEYWHLWDRENDELLQLYSSKSEAQADADALNSGDMPLEDFKS